MRIFRALPTFAALLQIGLSASGKPAKLTIVLVHGMFADSSSLNGVVAILEKDGYSVVAAANALQSVKGDAASVRSLLATITTLLAARDPPKPGLIPV